MTQEEIERCVKEMIVGQLGIEPEHVTPEASLQADLGADSLDMVDLVIAFEEEFNLDIPIHAERRLTTVAGCIEYIAERIKEREP